MKVIFFFYFAFDFAAATAKSWNHRKNKSKITTTTENNRDKILWKLARRNPPLLISLSVWYNTLHCFWFKIKVPCVYSFSRSFSADIVWRHLLLIISSLFLQRLLSVCCSVCTAWRTIVYLIYAMISIPSSRASVSLQMPCFPS